MAKEAGDYLDELIREKGEPKSWNDANQLIQEAAFRLGKDRHTVYGPNNLKEFGTQGILIRIYDKFQRLKNMVFKNVKSNDESIQDSFIDILNYSCYAIMIEKGWWELPVDTPMPDTPMPDTPTPMPILMSLL